MRPGRFRLSRLCCLWIVFALAVLTCLWIAFALAVLTYLWIVFALAVRAKTPDRISQLLHAFRYQYPYLEEILMRLVFGPDALQLLLDCSCVKRYPG
jgi:hypothetical protein